MEDLKDLIINTLDAQGVLGEIRAQLRMLVFKSIDNEGKQLPYDKTPAMQLADSDQGRLCLELLRDFLAFFKLNLSLNVLLPETRLTEEMQPEKLRELLGFRPEPGTPLLFQILDKLSEPDPQPRPLSKPEAQPWLREEEKDTQDFAGGRGAPNAFSFPAKKPAEIPKDKPAEKKPQEIPPIPAFKDKPVEKKPAEIPQIPPFREKPNEPSPFKDKEQSRDFPSYKDKPAEAPKQPKPAEVPQISSFKDKPKEIARPAEAQVPAFKEKPKEIAKPAEVPAIPAFKEKPKEVVKPAEVPAIPAFKDKPKEVAKPAEIPVIPPFKEEKKAGKLAPLREPMGRRLALDEDDTNEPEKERLRDIGRTLEQMQRADKAGKQVDMQLDLGEEVEEDLEGGSLEHLDSEEGDPSFHSDMLGAFDHAEDAEPLRRRS